jgi:hypothetical protein
MLNRFAKPFNGLARNLGDRLLEAGVAPRHVQRYLSELSDHLADLTAEEERAGRNRSDAEAAALIRLGGVEDLYKVMIEKRQLQSWGARVPWAVFGLGPLVVLTAAWYVALLLLWFGWRVFLPGSETPFVPVDGFFANIYFQADRAFFFGAPILIGWGIGVVAARQRLKIIWPLAGLALIALGGGVVQVQASRLAVPAGLGHISMGFGLGSPGDGPFYGPFRIVVILTLTVLPYLVWRLRVPLQSK